MSDEKPWEDYPDPMAAPAAPAPRGGLEALIAGEPQPTPPVGYGEDIVKGAAGGLGRGVAGTVGIGGTVGNLARAGLSKLGVSDQNLDRGAAVVHAMGAINPLAAILTGPDSSQVQKVMENYTGAFYQPKTVPGQYASTIFEYAPSMAIPGGGGIGARVFNTVVPALTSETAGQLTKGTAAEPYARALGGVAGGVIGGKLVTPAAPASEARQAAVATLDREGIPLTAGQRTGSRPIQWMESTAADMPFAAGQAQRLNAEQATAYNRAITARQFDPVELAARNVPEDVHLPDPRVVRAGRASLEDEYTRLSQNQLRSDPQLHSDMAAAIANYERNVQPSLRSGDVAQIGNDIVDQLVQGQGRMPGDVYQATRSRLGSLAEAQTKDPYLAGALRDMRGALDRTMHRGLSPADAEAWALNNQRWANMRTLEPAVASAGENLSPLAVAQSARAGRAGQSAAQTGNLDELTKAASMILKPLPNSGTAARSGWQSLFSLPTLLSAGSGGGTGFLLGGPLGAAAGLMLPFGAARAALSRGGQAYLGNQWLPQNLRDIIAQTLVEQAAAQPSGVARNEAEREEYRKHRPDPLRMTVRPRDAY